MSGGYFFHLVSVGSPGSFTRTMTNNEVFQQNTNQYFLHVTAIDPNTGDNVTLRAAFRVFGFQERFFCSLNMINTGTTPIRQGESLEFISVGSATNFTCNINNGPAQTCKDAIHLTVLYFTY